MSYLLYLSVYSPALMRAYLRTAMATCKLFGVQPSFLLHPLDILGGDLVPQLSFFPGMNLPTERKQRLFLEVLDMLGSEFDLVTMGAHAQPAVRWRARAPGAGVGCLITITRVRDSRTPWESL